MLVLGAAFRMLAFWRCRSASGAPTLIECMLSRGAGGPLPSYAMWRCPIGAADATKSMRFLVEGAPNATARLAHAELTVQMTLEH